MTYLEAIENKAAENWGGRFRLLDVLCFLRAIRKLLKNGLDPARFRPCELGSKPTAGCPWSVQALVLRAFGCSGRLKGRLASEPGLESF